MLPPAPRPVGPPTRDPRVWCSARDLARQLRPAWRAIGPRPGRRSASGSGQPSSPLVGQAQPDLRDGVQHLLGFCPRPCRVHPRMQSVAGLGAYAPVLSDTHTGDLGAVYLGILHVLRRLGAAPPGPSLLRAAAVLAVLSGHVDQRERPPEASAGGRASGLRAGTSRRSRGREVERSRGAGLGWCCGGSVGPQSASSSRRLDCSRSIIPAW